MRSIGKLNTATEASAFGDYLYSKGIENQIEQEEDGTHSVWILEDDRIPAAKEMLGKYLANPGADEFKDVSKLAKKKRDQEEKDLSRKRSQVASEERVIYEKNRGMQQLAPVTAILIAISVGVYFGFRDDHVVTSYLYFIPRRIFSGEVWRLVTPIFLHFSWYHIAFNMFMLFQIGGLIERTLGKLYLCLLVVVVAILSNTAQFWWDGPFFGGMSGVVYGLFGFIWIRSKLDRVPIFDINQNSVIIMIGWLFLCMSGRVGDIANAAHVAGLLVGMAWGFVTRNRFRN